MTPAETRKLFEDKGLFTAVVFQTRNLRGKGFGDN
jgi:ATP sulfurylase